ncbi:MAG: hypothetical protein VYE77_03815, partial [Planctomycetota bacterium]|nr:hypothetical protein [Planctomycetota bacterium]
MSRLDWSVLVQGGGEDLVREVARAWLGDEADAGATGRATTRQELVERIGAAMSDEARVVARRQALPERLGELLECFLQARTSLAVADLCVKLAASFQSRFELEACLAALQREGFLVPTADARWTNFEGDGYAVPSEIAHCIATHRQRLRCALRETLTLKGFLETEFFPSSGRARADERPAEVAVPGEVPQGRCAKGQRSEKVYKLYTLDAAIARRRAQLPEAVAKVVEFALVRHGGLVAWSELEQEFDARELPDPAVCKEALEGNLLGTVARLDWARYGLRSVDLGLVVFHEVAVAEMRRHAQANPVPVEQALRSGANLASNVARFLRELQQGKVQFTAQGKLFKASHKRVAGLLTEVPGGFLGAADQLDLLYGFCLHSGLIDRQGERLLRLTAAGQEFEQLGLVKQVDALLAWCIEDRSMAGEAFHQVRLRRLLLKWMRLLEPMRFEDLTSLPLLARSTYLSQLDQLRAEQHFAARLAGGGYKPTETLRQMGWNLMTWVKQRLYPLGIVDIGL